MIAPAKIKELDNQLHRIVCSICTDRRQDGSCNLGAKSECPITLHLERLVEITEQVNSSRLSDYLARVRSEVCPACPKSDNPAKCEAQAEGHCALDGYLLLIIELIDHFIRDRNHPAESVGRFRL